MRIALFITCFNDSLFPEAGRASVAVPERLVQNQRTCLGFPHPRHCRGTPSPNLGEGAGGEGQPRGMPEKVTCLCTVVPAIHKNRAEIRELFIRNLGVAELSDDPKDLVAVA